MLSMLCRLHSIPFDKFHSLYESIKTKRLGHLAAGADREGNYFFTVYYGLSPSLVTTAQKSIGGDKSVVRPTGNIPLQGGGVSPGSKKGTIKQAIFYTSSKASGFDPDFERSFKLMDRILLADRFLIGVKRETTESAQKTMPSWTSAA